MKTLKHLILMTSIICCLSLSIFSTITAPHNNAPIDIELTI